MAVTNKGGTPVLGLDIGAAFIKAVEMRPSKGVLTISAVGVLPTPPGCIVNDEIIDPAVLATAVKQLLTEAHIKTKNVVVSVAGQSSVVVRVIEVPKMSDKELAETMKWEIDRHIPFAPDEVVKDFQRFSRPGEDSNSPNMSVLLAVAQNGVVAGILQTVLLAGLTPVAIDVESLACARALFDVDDSFTGETVAVVNIGATKSDVGIFEKGTLAFPRTIPMAGNAMTEAIAQALNVDIAQAEHLKKLHGFVPDDASERFGSKAPVAEEHFDFGEFSGSGLNLSAPLNPSAAGLVTTPEGPVFEESAIPSFSDPMFGTAPTFGEPAPVFGVPFVPSEPTFDLPAVGPANSGPVEAPQAEAPVPEAPPALEVLTEAERNRREISDAFMPVVAELAAEIKRSLEYYSTRANNATVDRVVLFGGVTNLPGLYGFLREELGVPVQAAGLPRAVSIGNAAIPPEYVQQIAPLLPVAVGLGARDAIALEPAGRRKAA